MFYDIAIYHRLKNITEFHFRRQQVVAKSAFRTKQQFLIHKSEHQRFLKWPGEWPVFFLNAAYIADLDLKPESSPIPSME